MNQLVCDAVARGGLFEKGANIVVDRLTNICGVKDYKVTQTRCVEKGDLVCEYDIQWKET